MIGLLGFLFFGVFIAIICLLPVMLRSKDTSRMTPGQAEEYRYRRRRKLKWILWGVPGSFLILDLVFGCPGVRTAWTWLGRREMFVQNLEYRLSEDKREIVMTYELWTLDYDNIVRLAYESPEEIYHLYFDKSDRKSPPSPAKTVQKKEKRIPVDPMSGEVVKCYVEVVPDPGAPPVSTSGGYYPGVRGSLKGVHAPAFYTKTPFLIGNCARKEGWDPWDPSIPPTDSPDGPAADIPDGMEYRLKVIPHNMGTLSKGFLCGFADRRKYESPRYYVLMLPYDQCEDGRYVMLSQKDTTMPWPFLDEPLLDRDRRAVTELKTGANVFLKALWTPIVLVLDVAWLIVLFPVWCVINLIKLFLLSIAFIARFG